MSAPASLGEDGVGDDGMHGKEDLLGASLVIQMGAYIKNSTSF